MKMSVTNLRVNPAQMRTEIREDRFLALVKSIQHGFDPTLRLVVRARDDGAYDVISGHRRWLAAMIADPAHGLSVEATIKLYCHPQNGRIRPSVVMYEDLAARTAPLELEAEKWTGPESDSLLLLIKSNLSSEEPDLAGMGAAFLHAVEAGVTLPELAAATGIPERRVDAIMAVALLPDLFKDLINAGTLALELAPKIAELDIHERRALREGVEHLTTKWTDTESLTSRVKQALAELRWTPQLLVPDECHPVAYNQARILKRLWETATAETPGALKVAVVERALGGGQLRHGQGVAKVLRDLPGVRPLFGEDPFTLHTLQETAMDLLPDLSCDTCVFAKLPQHWLAIELDLPCRKHKGFPKAHKCLSWVPMGERFQLRTPWAWRSGGFIVHTLEELMKAWTDEDEAQDTGVSKQGSGGPSLIQDQRAAIRQYMERHATEPFNADHLWATPCDRCGYHLDASPVKSDPNAPHCWWAKGLKTLGFDAFRLGTDQDIDLDVFRTVADQDVGEPDMIIPSCRQFAPAAPWEDIIPESETESPYTPEMVADLVLRLASAANQHVYGTASRAALQFLSGRPELATGHHKKTFRAAFHQQKASLTAGQMWTLLQWMLLDWHRTIAPRAGAHIPVRGVLYRFFELPFSDTIAMLDMPGTADPDLDN